MFACMYENYVWINMDGNLSKQCVGLFSNVSKAIDLNSLHNSVGHAMLYIQQSTSVFKYIKCLYPILITANKKC